MANLTPKTFGVGADRLVAAELNGAADGLSRRNLVAAAAISPLLLEAAAAPAMAGPTLGVPQLFFTPAALTRARTLTSSPQLKTAWANLQAASTAALKSGTLAFANTSDPTRAWQRQIGWSMSNLAATFLLNGDTRCRDMAIKLASTAAAYPAWGIDSLEGGDLPAADLLFGIATVIDWLGTDIVPSVRDPIIAALRKKGTEMANYATAPGRAGAYWAKWWMMNHLWDNMVGLMAAGIALQPYDATNGNAFVATARGKLDIAYANLPPDGSTQESPTYWEFTSECVLKYHHLSKELFGTNLAGPWLVNAASFRAAMNLPLSDCTPARSIVEQADGSPSTWFGPEYQLRRLAALNRDAEAQQLASQVEAAHLTFPAAPWLNFIWFDPTVSGHPAPPPELRLFDDMAIVVSRTTTQFNENIVMMRAGPPFGKQAQSKKYPYDLGMSHVHPDVNHITLFAEGDTMLRDDGYSTRKLSAQHNTLLVDGAGQNYEGVEWLTNLTWPLPGRQPNLSVIATSENLDYWVGMGASSYPTSTQLTLFDRHVIFIKPNILVVIDELAIGRPATLSLIWHPGAAVEQAAAADQYVSRFSQTSLRASFVMPDGGKTSLGSRKFFIRKEAEIPEIAVTLTAPKAQVGALFAWGTSGGIGAVTLQRTSLTWTITTASQYVSLIPPQRRLTVRKR